MSTGGQRSLSKHFISLNSMKDADKHMGSILGHIGMNSCVLMLDFDGVLSPIVNVPAEASISPVAREALAECAKKMPTAIITGRTLSDIEKRVGLRNVLYAGNHGLEWKMGGRVRRKRISRKAVSEFATARHLLLGYAKLFPRLFVDDRRHCLALGYRSLSTLQAERLCSGARAILEKSDSAGTVRIIDNLFTFEIVATSEWTKGECAQHIFKTVAKKGMVAVYIGDTLTDEDAFRAFAQNGITIRVGESRTSAAQFYFKSRSRVDAFLTKIARQ